MVTDTRPTTSGGAKDSVWRAVGTSHAKTSFSRGLASQYGCVGAASGPTVRVKTALEVGSSRARRPNGLSDTAAADAAAR